MAFKRENVIRSAEKYVSKGKLEAAIKEYRKVLADNPNDANTLNRVGDLYARVEKFGEAVKLFTQIAEQYSRDGFFVKAIAIYKKIIKLDPTSLPVYERLAELYFKQGLLNEARQQYQVLADYYQKHDNATSAITIYQKMSQLEPENPSFHLKLAELFTRQRLIDKAMKSYRQLADILIVGGSVDEAIQVYFKAIEVSSEDLDFVRDAVSGLNEGGHVGAAAQVLAKAVELNPEAASLAAEVSLGESEDELDETPEEEEASTEVPEDDPFHVPEDVPETSFGDAATGAYVPEVEPLGGPTFEATASETFSEAPSGEVGTFSFSLEDDDEPESLVKPPEDLDGAPEEAFEEELEFELSLEDEGGEIEPEVPTEVSELEEDEATAIQQASAELEPSSAAVEIDWTVGGMGDLDLELPAAEPVAAEGFDEEPEPSFVDPSGLSAAPSLVESGEAAALALDDGPELELGDAPNLEFDEAPVLELDDTPVGRIEISPETSVSEAPTPEPEPAPVVTEVPETGSIARPEEDLLAEALVFCKYGLHEKARDRLGTLLGTCPDHLGGLALETRMNLEAGRHKEAIKGANKVASVARSSGELAPWKELQAELVEAGYGVDGDRVTREPGEKPAEDDRIAQLLEDLSLDEFGAPAAAASESKRRKSEATAEELLQGLTDSMSRPKAVSPVVTEIPLPPAEGLPMSAPEATPPPSTKEVSAPPPAMSPEGVESIRAAVGHPGETSGKKLISLVDELGLDDLDDELGFTGDEAGPVAVVTPTTPQPIATQAEAAAVSLDETGMSWLDDVASEGAEAEAPTAALFDDEDDFFDLASELERELSEDELNSDVGITHPQEQSLEEIIDGFKSGVAENLSDEDYDTHFNLGIAYREMGLLDEAIGEFQLASKDERHLVDSSSLLGVCFSEKGLPELALRWYRKGLESPTISDEATLGLLYDMADVYAVTGDSEAAYKTFVEVYGRNSNYRDVSSRLDGLRTPS